MSLGKKVFKNQRGAVSILVYDLLNQNANVRRNISDTFIEAIQTNVLQQYFMLSFTYNICRFSKGMDEEKYEEMYQDEERDQLNRLKTPCLFLEMPFQLRQFIC